MKRNHLILLILTPFLSLAQNIKGQATFTDSQILEFRNRISNGSGDYISTNFGGQQFYGSGNEIYNGAETFLNEEKTSQGFLNQWTYAFSESTLPVENSYADTEPTAVNSPAGISSLALDYIHYAAILSKVWEGDTTTIVTFSGEIKSRDAHSLDLKKAVFDVLNEQRADPNLDWSNTTKYDPTQNSINNPRFIYAAKMGKYLDSYSLIYDGLSGYAPFDSDYASVESWFLDCKNYYYAVLRLVNWEVFRAYEFKDVTTTTVNSANSFYKGARTAVWYDANGVAQAYSGWGEKSTLSNRNWDIIGYVGHYGLLFNDTETRDMQYEAWKLTLQLTYDSEGYHSEWDRATAGSGSSETNSINYVALNLWHHVKAAYAHAVAVENGLAGAGTDAGKYFDYTTSLGAEDLYTTGLESRNTGGSPKSLRTCVEGFRKSLLNTSNGGWKDVRYNIAGTLHVQDVRPYTIPIALANTYYKEQVLTDAYKLTTSEGYMGMDWYANSTTIYNIGPYHEHSMGLAWGSAGSYIGGWAGVADMESYVFIDTLENFCTSPSAPEGISPTEISVSTHDGNTPCNVMDNDLNTRWSAYGDGQWIQFDLGEQKEFDELQIAFYNGDTNLENGRIASFDIQVSNDASSWTTVLENQNSSGNSLELENFNFPSQNAKYIKYIGHGNTNNLWNSLTEARINKVIISCNDEIVNEDDTITLSTAHTNSWSGDDTISGTSSYTNNSDCALLLQKSNGASKWARYCIPIDLDDNSLNPGDEIQISIDGISISGNSIVRAVVDDIYTSDGMITEFSFGQNWTNFSETVSIPVGATTINVWLSPNWKSTDAGEAIFDNLSVSKVSSSASLKISKSLFDIEANVQEDKVSVFPNPSSNEVHVLLDATSKYLEYSIHSISGSLIEEGAIDENQKELYLNISTLEKGIYTLKILDSEGKNTTTKIIKK